MPNFHQCTHFVEEKVSIVPTDDCKRISRTTLALIVVAHTSQDGFVWEKE